MAVEKEKADKKKKKTDLPLATNASPRPKKKKTIYSEVGKDMKAILKDLSHIPKGKD